MKRSAAVYAEVGTGARLFRRAHACCMAASKAIHDHTFHPPRRRRPARVRFHDHLAPAVARAPSPAAGQRHAGRRHRPARRAGRGPALGQCALARRLGYGTGRSTARRRPADLHQPDRTPDRAPEHGRQPGAHPAVQRDGNGATDRRRRRNRPARVWFRPGAGNHARADLRRARRRDARARHAGVVRSGRPEPGAAGRRRGQPVPARLDAGHHAARYGATDGICLDSRRLQQRHRATGRTHHHAMAVPDRARRRRRRRGDRGAGRLDHRRHPQHGRRQQPLDRRAGAAPADHARGPRRIAPAPERGQSRHQRQPAIGRQQRQPAGRAQRAGTVRPRRAGD